MTSFVTFDSRTILNGNCVRVLLFLYCFYRVAQLRIYFGGGSGVTGAENVCSENPLTPHTIPPKTTTLNEESNFFRLQLNFNTRVRILNIIQRIKLLGQLIITIKYIRTEVYG